MNVSQLEYYVLSVEEGSYASASKRLYVDPSTISLAVNKLESEFGVQLLERSNAGIVPTNAGKQFYEKACVVLTSITQLSEVVAASARSVGEAEVLLAIAEDPWLGTLIGERVIRAFERRSKGVTVNLMRNEGTICLAALRKNAVDAALMLGATKDESLVETRLFSKKVCILVGDDFPLTSKGKIRLSSLIGTPIALPFDYGLLYDKIVQGFEKYAAYPFFTHVDPGYANIVDFVTNNRGAVFSLRDGRLGAKYPSLRMVALEEDDDFALPVYFVHASSETNAGVVLLKNYLANCCFQRMPSVAAPGS